MEQRQAKRVHLFQRVQVDDGTNVLETFCLDISMRGILLVLPERVNWHLEQALKITLTTEAGEVLMMNCSLVHVDDDVVGCACDSMDLESQQVLRGILETSLEVPSQINRELSELISSSD
ncbi:PilZ domain-containing protein [uncultured Thalassolituus sp.]|uniref:PilZ domain-containing protein n=1 Tax=uncultured Thalassolituus sp. TaxID=285273 RepID=UPI00261B9D4A|nr:PilZ domain-containing protein [uncultured Thalassolituus sp.]